MALIVCQPSVSVARCTRARALPHRVPAAASKLQRLETSLSSRAPIQRRSVIMSATTDVGIQELEGLCMASLQGLGYTRDEASVLTEVRTVASIPETDMPRSFESNNWYVRADLCG